MSITEADRLYQIRQTILQTPKHLCGVWLSEKKRCNILSFKQNTIILGLNQFSPSFHWILIDQSKAHLQPFHRISLKLNSSERDLTQTKNKEQMLDYFYGRKRRFKIHHFEKKRLLTLNQSIPGLYFLSVHRSFQWSSVIAVGSGGGQTELHNSVLRFGLRNFLLLNHRLTSVRFRKKRPKST